MTNLSSKLPDHDYRYHCNVRRNNRHFLAAMTPMAVVLLSGIACSCVSQASARATTTILNGNKRVKQRRIRGINNVPNRKIATTLEGVGEGMIAEFSDEWWLLYDKDHVNSILSSSEYNNNGKDSNVQKFKSKAHQKVKAPKEDKKTVSTKDINGVVVDDNGGDENGGASSSDKNKKDTDKSSEFETKESDSNEDKGQGKDKESKDDSEQPQTQLSPTSSSNAPTSVTGRYDGVMTESDVVCTAVDQQQTTITTTTIYSLHVLVAYHTNMGVIESDVETYLNTINIPVALCKQQQQQQPMIVEEDTVPTAANTLTASDPFARRKRNIRILQEKEESTAPVVLYSESGSWKNKDTCTLSSSSSFLCQQTFESRIRIVTIGSRPSSSQQYYLRNQIINAFNNFPSQLFGNQPGVRGFLLLEDEIKIQSEVINSEADIRDEVEVQSEFTNSEADIREEDEDKVEVQSEFTNSEADIGEEQEVVIYSEVDERNSNSNTTGNNDKNDKDFRRLAIIALAIVVAGFVMLIALFVLIRIYKQRQKKMPSSSYMYESTRNIGRDVTLEDGNDTTDLPDVDDNVDNNNDNNKKLFSIPEGSSDTSTEEDDNDFPDDECDVPVVSFDGSRPSNDTIFLTEDNELLRPNHPNEYDHGCSVAINASCEQRRHICTDVGANNDNKNTQLSKLSTLMKTKQDSTVASKSASVIGTTSTASVTSVDKAPPARTRSPSNVTSPRIGKLPYLTNDGNDEDAALRRHYDLCNKDASKRHYAHDDVVAL